MTRYAYRQALGAFFHVDESFVRSRLPRSLMPLGARAGSAILSALVFDFIDSEAGPFTELALMWVVPPEARAGLELPLIGVYPFLLATSTEASRDLARGRLRLPVQDTLIETRFSQEGPMHHAEVLTDGERLLRLAVKKGRTGESTSRLYQCFAQQDPLFDAPVQMRGWVAEHQEEVGRLELSDHAWVRGLESALEDNVPFREQFVENGLEDFGDMKAST